LLDFGTDSKPVFYDFDFDGLPDLMVGNYGYFRPFQTYKSTVAYYRNTGTRTHPQFEMQSEDYGNISNYGFVAVYPAFGDLDGDSKPDMLIGELNGYLHFFKNTGSSTSTFNSLTTTQYFGIDVGQYSAPFIYDVNGDSLNDLVVGRVDGKISYYWNFGTKTNPLFSQDSVNNFFGSINVTQTGYPQGHSQPVVVKDNTGLKLLVGSYRGTVFEYAPDTTKLRGGSFALIDSDFLKQDVGTKATITVAEITGDTLTEYVVGNSRGGLLMFSDSLWDTSTLSSVNEINTVPGAWHIYPNPANNYLVCEAENINTETVQVLFYNVLGERIITPVQQSGHKLTINTAPLASGFYILRIETSGQNSAYKVLIER
jgi:hypothetical protein